ITTLCSGESVALEITKAQGSGDTPTYELFVDNNSEGTVSFPYTLSGLADGNHTIKVNMESSSSCASPTNDESPEISVTLGEKAVPSFEIAVAENLPVCEGSTVNFSIINDQNSGASPSYEWLVDGTSQTIGATYSAALSNGEVVTAKMTVIETCVTSATVDASNSITMTTTTPVTPSISISTTATEACSSDQITFSIDNRENEGGAATYQWLKDGNPIASQTGESLLIDATELVGGEQISLEMTSSLGCVTNGENTVTSNALGVVVSTAVDPTVSLSAETSTQICANTSVDFKAIAGAGNGSNATYEWFIDGVSTNTISAAEEIVTLNFGSNLSYQITVVASNLSSCANTPIVTSDPTEVNVISPITPNIAIQELANNNCLGDQILFAVDAGSLVKDDAGTYEWYVDGNPTGIIDQTTLSSNDYALVAGSIVTAKLTLGTTCNTAPEETSNAFTVEVKPSVTPSVNISSVSEKTACESKEVRFDIDTINVGKNPTFTWKVNGNATEINSSLYYYNTTNLPEGINIVTVEVTASSDVECPTQNPSNASQPETVTILKSETMTIQIEGYDGQVCKDDLVNLSVNVQPLAVRENLSYDWTVDGNTVGTNGTYAYNATETGTINVTVTSEFQCLKNTNDQASTSLLVDVLEPTAPTLAVNEEKICEGENLTFTETSASSASLVWYKGNEVIPAAEVISNAQISDAGVYSIGSTEGVCSELRSEGISVAVLPRPTAEIIAPNNYVVLEGDVVTLTGKATNYTELTWTGGDLSPSNEGLTYSGAIQSDAVITFTARNELDDCTVEDITNIQAIETVKIPSVFTPNGDGIHDVWEIVNMEDYPDAHVQIFTRWGQKVFETYGGYAENPWKGVGASGSDSPIGVYYYIINLNSEVEILNEPINGEVHILR
ncbi:MAG: gliding motility-associated C-terminal domain-containing protein, partial [Cytophagales bacterium]|nr:gliding motility-associated C-terminal domain-containing protein [Cytophagales bacterium]